ncbi:MAG: YebC/PmpR family DNA-binding transcriptional regulator, partial [Pseudomonadota bacterium]|nr:YebC/PmpR family DNA-binding transcriptional regulator [Pseudomonadota bacterium]
SEDGKVSVFTPNTEYGKARQAIIDAFGEVDFDVDEIQFIPQMTTEISGEDVEQFERFLDLLNDLDDVQRVYHNAEF